MEYMTVASTVGESVEAFGSRTGSVEGFPRSESADGPMGVAEGSFWQGQGENGIFRRWRVLVGEDQAVLQVCFVGIK
jgi:hypothetical protein